MLERFYLQELAHRKIGELSGGQQQRTAIGRAIVKNPDILLCDEPTGALDHQLASKIYDNIELLRDEYNKTVLIVTHDLELAQKTDKVIDISTL